MISHEQNISLSLFETFVTFAKEKTTAKTAAILGLTQPTVSRQLLLLENSLPRPIFTMKGRNKILTDYGKSLAKELEKHFFQIGKSLQEINQEFLEPHQIRIKIAARQEILECYLSHFDFPGTVELLPMGTKEVNANIQAQTIDLAITHNIDFPSDYIRKKFFISTAKIIIPKKWFTTKPTLAQWKQQSTEYPVAHYEGSFSHLEKYKTLYGINKNFKVGLISQHWPLIEKRTELGKSWAIIPSSFINDKNTYYVLDLPSEFEEQVFYLVYRKEFQKQEWFKRFLISLNI